MVLVREVHGGTRGTDYIFVIEGNEILHLQQLGAKCVYRGKGRRREVIWDVPDDKIADHEIVWVSYSRSGNLYADIRRAPSTLGRELDIPKLPIVKAKTEQVLEYLKQFRFRMFGREIAMANDYLRFVPRLVNDFWKSIAKLGIKKIYVEGKRLDEVLNDPYIGYVISMLLPTGQGRVLSLFKKLSGMFELWVFSKIVDALSQLGKVTLSGDWIWLEATTNRKILEFDVSGTKYSIFYQPSILPHVISGFLPEPELNKLKERLGVKELHLIPDIVLAKNVNDLRWGELYKVRDKIKLIVEAKLSLRGLTEFDTVELAESQIEAYKKLLNADVLVVILEPNKRAKLELETTGVKVIDNALNSDGEIVELVKSIVQ